MIVLNLHGVGPVPRSIDSGERECWLESEMLERILDLAVDRPNVRLTVDDGNASDAEIILPSLLRRGLAATFFICSARLDQPTFLSRAQVRLLLAQGMKVGSHGAAHRSWCKLRPSEEREEMEDAKAELDCLCGAGIDSAACPFGIYDSRVLSRLREAGFRHVYTSDGGSADEQQFVQARNTIRRSTDAAEIHRLLRRGPGLLAQSVTNLKKRIKSARI